MKKIIFLFIAFILSACTPQVTVTSTVTSPPPTQTPIPTPTLHPEFVELQNQIADSGENLTLLPNGQIEENGVVIPNLQVDQNGEISIVVEGENIIVDLTDVTFENGFAIEGYEQNENGEWVEAISPEVQAAMAEFDKYTYSTENLEFKQNGDDVWAVDKESGKTVYEKDGDSQYGLFYQEYAVEQAGQLDLMPTDIEPRQDILKATGQYFVADGAKAFEYFGPLFRRVRVQFEQEFGYDPVVNGKSTGIHAMLNPEIKAWGNVTKLEIPELGFDRFLFYELADGTIHIVPLR